MVRASAEPSGPAAAVAAPKAAPRVRNTRRLSRSLLVVLFMGTPPFRNDPLPRLLRKLGCRLPVRVNAAGFALGPKPEDRGALGQSCRVAAFPTRFKMQETDFGSTPTSQFFIRRKVANAMRPRLSIRRPNAEPCRRTDIVASTKFVRWRTDLLIEPEMFAYDCASDGALRKAGRNTPAICLSLRRAIPGSHGRIVASHLSRGSKLRTFTRELFWPRLATSLRGPQSNNVFQRKTIRPCRRSIRANSGVERQLTVA